MRACLAPVALLLGILGLALWNGAHIAGECARWQGQLQQVEALAVGGDWDGALAALDAGHGDWSRGQTYLHVVAEHGAGEAAEAMYLRAASYAAAQELTELRAELSGLREQLRLLAETERLSLGNIL